MRPVLRRKDFRRLFAGVVSAMVGETALLLVLAIWVKDMTGSNSLAGLTIFAIVAPALAAPVLGWVVDRFRRRPFLVATLIGTIGALVPLLLVRDADDVWLIYVVAVLPLALRRDGHGHGSRRGIPVGRSCPLPRDTVSVNRPSRRS